ncbi:MAG: ACT domain-containing protein [Limnochordaceae bacterium]|nr:ACT domain-containing protein [Limnochordaceae bacterium]
MSAHYRSIFDIIGPVMIGPSSSHTAGPARLGRVARNVLAGALAHQHPQAQPGLVRATLYGSLAATARGHGTDLALLGGLLGLAPDDPRLREADQLAAQAGLVVQWETGDRADLEQQNLPPTSIRLQVWPAPAPADDLPETPPAVDMLGVSVGGGSIEVRQINGFPVSFAADQPTLLVFHRDRPGVVAQVAMALARAGINLSQMSLGRKGRGRQALMVITTDQPIPIILTEQVRQLSSVDWVAVVETGYGGMLAWTPTTPCAHPSGR